jgi:histidine triad (HIT) family protein
MQASVPSPVPAASLAFLHHVGVVSDFYCDEVLSGKTPVEVVRETESVLAYHHTRPFWPVHIVVIPKRHVPSLTDLGGAPEGLLDELMGVVRSVAREVEREYGAARVLTNLGEYQDSKHLHFHVNFGAARSDA